MCFHIMPSTEARQKPDSFDVKDQERSGSIHHRKDPKFFNVFHKKWFFFPSGQCDIAFNDLFSASMMSRAIRVPNCHGNAS